MEKHSKENPPSELSDNQGELLEDELEHISGGMNPRSIQKCKVCEQRVAVHGMAVCASCFREQNPIT